jgi:hypothetical protein
MNMSEGSTRPALMLKQSVGAVLNLDKGNIKNTWQGSKFPQCYIKI